jgi:hypothetical protein
MTEEQKEQWGQFIDRLENLQYALEMKIPAEMHVKQFRKEMPELVKEQKQLFIEVTGENPWE